MAFQNIQYSPSRSNYIPLPLDEMNQIFQTRQQAYDENLAFNDQLQMAVSQMKFLDAANPLKKELADRANKIIETVASNEDAWEYAKPTIRHFARELATDERVKNASESYQKYQSALADAKEKDVSNFQTIKIQNALKQYNEEYASGKNPIFQAPHFYEEFQLFKEVDDMLSGWKADSSKKTVKNGVAYWDVAGESISEKELRKHATKTLLSDPKYSRQVRDMVGYQMEVVSQDPDKYINSYIEELDKAIAKLDGDKKSDPQTKQTLLETKEALEADPDSALRSIITNETLSGIVDPMAAKHSYTDEEISLNKFDPYWLESIKFQFAKKKMDLENRMNNLAMFEPNNPLPYDLNRKQIISDLKADNEAKRDLELRIKEARSNGDQVDINRYQQELESLHITSRRKANKLTRFENHANIDLDQMYYDYQQQMIRNGLTGKIVEEDQFKEALRHGRVSTVGNFFKNIIGVASNVNPVSSPPVMGMGSSVSQAHAVGMDTEQFSVIEPFVRDYQNKLSNAPKKLEETANYQVVEIIKEDKDKLGESLQNGIISLLRSGTVPIHTMDGQRIVEANEIFYNPSLQIRPTTQTAENGSVVFEMRYNTGSGKNKEMQNVLFTVDAKQATPILNDWAAKNFNSGNDAYMMYFNTLDGGSLSAGLSGANIGNMRRNETRSVVIPVTTDHETISHKLIDIIRESDRGFSIRMPHQNGDKVLVRDTANNKMIFEDESAIRAYLGRRYAENR